MLLKKRNKVIALMSLWLLAAACCAAGPTVRQDASTDAQNGDLVRVSIYQLVVDPSSQQPVVSLADAGEKRALFIWIGLAEARAIYSEIEGIEHSRPLTHDLLEKIIQKADGVIHHIVITHSQDNIYYATIFLQKGDNLVEIDARPSDSLVMALRFDAPVYVSRNLFDKMSQPLELRANIEESYGLSLQELTPDLAEYMAFELKKGVLVSGVREGSQAAKDGIRTGDIIVAVAGRTVEDLPFFRQAFTGDKDPLSIKIYRHNQFQTLTVHPD